MALTPQQFIGPCLDKIVDGASGRKYSKLKTDAKVSNFALLYLFAKTLSSSSNIDKQVQETRMCLLIETSHVLHSGSFKPPWQHSGAANSKVCT
jgi:hypothetical protein